MRNILYLATFLSFILFITACNKKTDNGFNDAEGYSYYPLEIGKYILYDVDSIYWDDFLRAEVHHRSQMRYECVDSFKNGTGQVSYVINVTERATPTSPYHPSEVIHVTLNNDRLIVNQQNMQFINLVFPIENGKTWDGLAMIPLEHASHFPERFQNPAWSFEYSNKNVGFDPGNRYYNNTVTVNHIDDSLNNPEEDSTAYAYKNYSTETYAQNVGMVHKELVYWVFQPRGPGGSGGSGYRKGYAVTMRAVDNN